MSGNAAETVAPGAGVSSTRPWTWQDEYARLPEWNAGNRSYEDWPVGQDTIDPARTDMEQQPNTEQLGLVRASHQAFKAERELVLHCEHIQTVKYRDPDARRDGAAA